MWMHDMFDCFSLGGDVALLTIGALTGPAECSLLAILAHTLNQKV